MFRDLAVIPDRVRRSVAARRRIGRGERRRWATGSAGSTSPAPSTAATCSRSATRSTSAAAAAPTTQASPSSRHLEPLGAQVVAVPITKVLHLKSAVTALPDGTVIGYPPLVDDTGAFDPFLPVPEEPGSHVVLLDDTTLLMATSAPRTAEILAARGHEIVQVDISEYEKLEGCVTCLSVRLRG